MNELLTTEYFETTLLPSVNISSNESSEGGLTKIQLDVPAYIVIILIAIGTIGNVLVCLTIFLDKKLQNVTNFFLFSLAITDLLINVAALPARIAIFTYVLQPSSFPWCILYLVGDEYLTLASALHICSISVERYFAIKNPMDKRRLTRRVVCIKIVLVWLVSFLTIIPYLTIVIISKYPTQASYCPNLPAYFDWFDIVLYVECFIIFVMVAVVVFSFIGTSTILYRLAKKQEANGSSGLVRTVGGNISKDTTNKAKNKLQALQSERRALKVVWLVSFAFIIATAPYAMVNMFYLISPDIPIPNYIPKLVSYLNYMNSVINPILYTIFNKQFRGNFKKIIMFKYKQG